MKPIEYLSKEKQHYNQILSEYIIIVLYLRAQRGANAKVNGSPFFGDQV
jgi:hypothetical protein